MTGGLNVSAQLLNAVTRTTLSEALSKAFKLPSASPLPQIWANVNGPNSSTVQPLVCPRIGATASPMPQVLMADNPSYASLIISWVRPPTSYKPGSYSSLVVAFEEGNLKALLAERYLYSHGTRAPVKIWMQRSNNKEDKSSNHRCQARPRQRRRQGRC